MPAAVQPLKVQNSLNVFIISIFFEKLGSRKRGWLFRKSVSEKLDGITFVLDKIPRPRGEKGTNAVPNS